MEPSTTPGWYPDPAGRYEFRYHNGVRWTGDVSVDGQRYVEPESNVGPPAGQPVGRPPLTSQTGGRGGAITALVLGIVGASLAWLPFVFVVGAVAALVGLVFGTIAIRRHSNGRKMAVWGTVLSVLALPLCIVGYAFTRVVMDELEDPGAHIVHITRCESRSGFLAEGTIDNLSDVNRYYEVTVSFRVDGTEVRSTTVNVDDVDDGDSAAFRAEAAAPVGVGGDVECVVSSVKNNLP